MKKNHVTLIAVGVMGLAFVAAAVFYNTDKTQVQNERASKHSEALIKPYSPRAGNSYAKVTIVEFMDPACGTCRDFHPLVKKLLKTYSGKVNLVIRYAPFHKGSGEMVAILEASRKQDKFNEVLDLMFETQSQWTANHQVKSEVFWRLLANAGYDIKRLREDMNDPDIKRVIMQDLEDGKLVGANKTPTFFVNGKPLPSFGYDQLRNLVQAEVSANY